MFHVKLVKSLVGCASADLAELSDPGSLKSLEALLFAWHSPYLWQMCQPRPDHHYQHSQSLLYPGIEVDGMIEETFHFLQ